MTEQSMRPAWRMIEDMTVRKFASLKVSDIDEPSAWRSPQQSRPP